jgi:hypothetical protein
LHLFVFYFESLPKSKLVVHFSFFESLPKSKLVVLFFFYFWVTTSQNLWFFFWVTTKVKTRGSFFESLPESKLVVHFSFFLVTTRVKIPFWVTTNVPDKLSLKIDSQ